MNIGKLLALGTLLILAGCAAGPTEHATKVEAERASAAYRMRAGEVTLSADVASHHSPDDQAELLRQLREALAEGLSQSRPTTADDPAALRVDLLVTALDEVRPSVNALTTLLLFVPMDMGGIQFEAHIHDAAGATVATLEHHDRSTPLDLKGSFNRFGHARNAVREWAHGLNLDSAPAQASR